MTEETKIVKDPVTVISKQLQDQKAKAKQEELKKAIEEIMAARTVLETAVLKAKRIQKELENITTDKFDLNALAKQLGV